MKMNVLILGGSGILSSDVCRNAIGHEYIVTCVTRGNRDFALPHGAKVIHGDANNLSLVADQLDEQYDAVLDFLSLDVNQLISKVQVLAPICKQYFFVSSATVYKLVDGKITEDTQIGNEYWNYGENKVNCENYLRSQGEKLGLTYTIIRPYVTYGNTRIPFAIISNGNYWSLANRILCDKPILLWDDGKAICTITHTADFAKAFMGLIGNKEAYNEAFHITSNEELTWKKVLDDIAKALNKRANVFSCSTSNIVKVLPEYYGILWGDKSRDRIFDNSKIMEAVHEFNDCTPFCEGIKQTVEFYKSHEAERKIDYMWDGRIDRAIIKLSKKHNILVAKNNLKFLSSEKTTRADVIAYYAGRYLALGIIYKGIRKIKRKLLKK